ncbi:MAG: 2-C-methyl-D-erythritol 2,4-cyclodiphosphate synthase [Bacilli bacterium]|nr:2-C-methyl-D-erythritol 2,4-cyclodiphosphate synthase [Bacilli bacterium]
MYRIGQSTDIHQLALNKKLILGGISIPSDFGCVAHSDGDVLTHAITEAIIGALGLNDLGYHFSDKDPVNKNRSSLEMLTIINDKMHSIGYEIVNIDSIIIIEKPKLRPYINDIRTSLAQTLNIDKSLVNVKATCAEKLGFIGEGKGIMAQAIVMVRKDES